MPHEPFGFYNSKYKVLLNGLETLYETRAKIGRFLDNRPEISA